MFDTITVVPKYPYNVSARPYVDKIHYLTRLQNGQCIVWCIQGPVDQESWVYSGEPPTCLRCVAKNFSMRVKKLGRSKT